MDKHPLVDNAAAVGRVLWITFFLNVSVSIAKLFWGYASGSVGMVSDGFHSMMDGVTNIIGLIGIRIASAPPDREHPYGHRKVESIFTSVIGLMIFATCFEIIRKTIAALSGERVVEVTSASFIVMIVTMAVNIFVMRYERAKGLQLGSDFLSTDASHTQSDIITSGGVLAGLTLSKLGLPHADAIAGLVVAVFIARIGFDILKTSAEVLLDTGQVDTKAVYDAVLSVQGVTGCHDIRSRGSQHHISLDLHIQLPPDTPLKIAHAKTHEVQEVIKKVLPAVHDIVVHTEPEK